MRFTIGKSKFALAINKHVIGLPFNVDWWYYSKGYTSISIRFFCFSFTFYKKLH